MVPGTPSQKLSALLLLWPSFLCLMFRYSGLYYFVTGLFCLSLQWGAKLHTWSNTNIFHSTLGNRWDSYSYSYPCVFGHNHLGSPFVCHKLLLQQEQLILKLTSGAWKLTLFLIFDRNTAARKLLQVAVVLAETDAHLSSWLEQI